MSNDDETPSQTTFLDRRLVAGFDRATVPDEVKAAYEEMSGTPFPTTGDIIAWKAVRPDSISLVEVILETTPEHAAELVAAHPDSTAEPGHQEWTGPTNDRIDAAMARTPAKDHIWLISDAQLGTTSVYGDGDTVTVQLQAARL